MANVMDGTNRADFERVGSWVVAIEDLNEQKETVEVDDAFNKIDGGDFSTDSSEVSE